MGAAAVLELQNVILVAFFVTLHNIPTLQSQLNYETWKGVVEFWNEILV